MEKMKTGFVERIGDTIFVVNAMPAENAEHTQEELVKALVARETMALQEADVARLTLRTTIRFGDFSKNISKPLDRMSGFLLSCYREVSLLFPLHNSLLCKQDPLSLCNRM